MSDLISRQAAIDAIHNLYAIHGSEGSWIDQKDAFKALNSLPSAEPVRHGKWVPKTIIIGGRDHVSGMKCSVCGEDPLNAEGDEFLTDYCPNCGADMRGEQDDESRSNSNAQTDTRARGMGATDKSSGI